MQPSEPAAPKIEGRNRSLPLRASKLPDNAYSVTKTIHFSDCGPTKFLRASRFLDLVNCVLEDLFVTEFRINYSAVSLERETSILYASVDTDFFEPARAGDNLVFTPLISHVGRTSVVFLVHCHRGAEEIMRCRVAAVTTSLNTSQAISMPSDIKNALIRYRDNYR
jgi:4-hydroxybenzoyl-CoA thioesterase